MAAKSSTLKVDAARYLLLRRLAPSLRHRLVGTLHPIGLLAEVARQRLANSNADLAAAAALVTKMQGHAREAANCATALFSWLSGEEASSVAFDEGVDACVNLLRTDLEVHGASVVASCDGIAQPVSQRALRTVLCASLIAAAEMLPPPVRIAVHARANGDEVELTLDVQLEGEERRSGFIADDQPVTMEDVELLARSEGVDCFWTRQPPRLQYRFPVLQHPAHAGLS